MRVKRLKKASRVLTFFRYHYNFLSPYSVILDGTFCQAALKNKINLREQMPKYLAGEVIFYTTKCVIKELEELGSELHGALVVAKQFPIAKCPHQPMRSAAECIKHMARRSKTKDTKKTKFFIGTQDDSILERLREIGGIPLLSIRYNTILLEKPSESSVTGAKKVEPELEKVRELKAKIFGTPDQKRKRKGPMAPNPLSCKKKKVKKSLSLNKMKQGGETEAKRKRIRKKKRDALTES